MVAGEDPRDSETAVMHGRQSVGYADYATRKSLAGKRLGVVRDFMIEATIADRDSLRVGNAALAEMKRLGATLVDPVDFHSAIAAIMPAYDPGFFTQSFPEAIPAGSNALDRMAEIASDPKTLPGGGAASIFA